MSKENQLKRFGALTDKELLQLYIEYVEYRDKECGGRAYLTVEQFYKERGL